MSFVFALVREQTKNQPSKAVNIDDCYDCSVLIFILAFVDYTRFLFVVPEITYSRIE